MNVSIKKIAAIILPSFLLFVPVIVFAQNIVPCGTTAHPEPCDFKDLSILANNFLNYFIAYVYAPLVSLIIIYIGFLFVKDQAEAKTKAKKILWQVVVGTFIVLGAWVLVNLVITQFINPETGITNPLSGH